MAVIVFEHPGRLWLAVPWLFAWWVFAWHQRRAHGWVLALVAPRHRRRLTRVGARGLGVWLAGALVAGGLLVVAAAGPGSPKGGGARAAGGRVLVLLDASASMAATDLTVAAGEEPVNRFEAARRLALALVDGLPDERFALASFSGVTTLHLPATTDRQVAADALRSADFHTFYRSTGSSLEGALDLVLEMAEADLAEAEPTGAEASGKPLDLQVVLIGDGEVPQKEDFEPSLAAVAALGVPVHAVAVGSEAGQARLIYHMADVAAGKAPDERRVLAEFTTRRVDGQFRHIASSTGGRFATLESGSVPPELVQRLVKVIRRVSARRPAARDEAAARDLSAWPLAFFLLFFVVDAVLDRWRRPVVAPAFDLARLGRTSRGPTPPAVVLVLLLPFFGAVLGCGEGAATRAHRENEAGIAFDTTGAHAIARTHYRRSAAEGVRPEVPIYNRARSTALEGDLSAAHDQFQEALRLAPGLGEAIYGDGVVLYGWGEEERDPAGCQLDRTLELWRAAAGRFREVVEGAFAEELRRDAAANGAHVAERVAALEALQASPPEACGGSSGGGGAAGDGGGGGGTGGDRGGGGGAGSEPGRPPRAGEAPPGAAPEGAGNDLDGPLSPDQLAGLEAELERIRGQAQEPGKLHRRTRQEQFPKSEWQAPEPKIWW
ncbi:MAG: VWA domain-containing protein [Acidobacteria bacterium]|nr:VWA domain-containing protein [Acidobacteriota bacterium]